MSSKKSSTPKRKRSIADEDEDVQLAESGRDSSGGESDGERSGKPHYATSASELTEAKRLKSLAYTKRLLHDNSAQQSAAQLPLPASLLPHSHSDIQKKSEARTNPRFLCLFPGQFRLLPSAHAAIKQQDEANKRRPSDGAADSTGTADAAPPAVSFVAPAGRIGSLEALDSRNPVMNVDFPTGRLRLTGTIVYPADTTYIAIAHSTRAPSGSAASKGKKVKPLQCQGTFDHLLVFSEWSWLGRKEDNPTEQPLPLPEELTQQPDGAVMKSSAPVEEVVAESEVEDDDEEEDGTRAAAQRELEKDRENDLDDYEDEKDEAETGGKRQSSSSASRRGKRDEWDSDAEDSDAEDDSEVEETEEDRGKSASATRRPQRATRKEVKYDVDVQSSDEEEKAEDEAAERGRRSDEDEAAAEKEKVQEVREVHQEIKPVRRKILARKRPTMGMRREKKDDGSSGGDDHSSDESYN